MAQAFATRRRCVGVAWSEGNGSTQTTKERQLGRGAPELTIRWAAVNWRNSAHVSQLLQAIALAVILLDGWPLAAARVPAHAQASPVTFARDVAPILFAHCAACHRPGQLAPFSLLTYEDARQHARQLADVTKSRFMPPWKPDSGDFPFAGVRRLDDREIQVFQQWLESGSPEGDRGDLPPAPAFTSDWQLGPPDLVLTMPEAFEVPADGRDVFRNFVLRVPLERRRYVRAIELRPGNPRVIHHARILVDESDASEWRDAQDAGPGFGGMDAPEAHFPEGHFLGWAPGKLPTRESQPWPIAPGTDFVIQMHLRPTGKPERVQASLGLYLSDAPPAAAPVLLRLGSRTIDIPPGASNYVVRDSYVLPADVTALRVYPHAHYLGREMTVTATFPGGVTKRLLHIASWDFNWQDEYEYAKPVPLPRGTTVSMTYTYDNSAANPRNPHAPPIRVRSGPEATDEMGELLLQLLPSARGDFDRLRSDVARKAVAADTAGDEKRVADAPDDVQARNALGADYFEAGRMDAALAQFNTVIRLDPGHAPAHFNLALIATLQGRTDEAVAHLRAAIAARPGYAEAHNNLGIVLMQQGALAAADAQFRESLRIRPENADARYNLARTLVAEGRIADAVAEFQQAVVGKPDAPAMLDDLAWILATSTDAAIRAPGQAVTFAERAVQLTGGKVASVLDTLGAAYAADGRYDAAARAVQQAIDLARAAKAPEMERAFVGRLHLYQQHQPYREPPHAVDAHDPP